MTTKTLIAGPKLKTAIPAQCQAHSGGRRQIYFSFLHASYPMVAKRGRGIVSKSGWQ